MTTQEVLSTVQSEGVVIEDESLALVAVQELAWTQIDDPDFVEKKYRESLDDQMRIKGKGHLYTNLDIIKGAYSMGWGQTPHHIYRPIDEYPIKTADGTAVQGKVVVTEEEIVSLGIQGYEFRGRIVCKGGSVYDADMNNKLTSTLSDGPDGPVTKSMMEYFDKLLSVSIITLWPKNPPQKFLVTTSTDHHGRNIPSHGEYTILPKPVVKSEEGLTCYTMCDDPECSLLGHLILATAATPGFIPSYLKTKTISYFSKRPMYKLKDEVNGDFDICYDCLVKKGSVSV